MLTAKLDRTFGRSALGEILLQRGVMFFDCIPGMCRNYYSWHVPQLFFLWPGKMYAEQVGFEQYLLEESLNSTVLCLTLRQANGPRSVLASARGMAN